MEQKFCQSCAMPLEDPKMYGTNADGSKSEDYCQYCYENGAFTADMSMEEMITFTLPHMVQANAGMTEDAARAALSGFFPTLKRWQG